ncbi:Sca4 family protein [Candidatus Tisiphia endosymbiont of Neophilaenus lineatus]|uniref:Sca4 family protein n=1 Tax=Candidatus Tisiphia endosymbiont of Neophilaenus lineatus TaxID=3139336 RepID=UPI0035CC257F
MTTPLISKFIGWNYLAKKSLGANDGGELGGIYKSSDDLLSMIKSEGDSRKNISEFLGSQIFQATNPNHGAKVSLTVPDHLSEKVHQQGGLQSDGSEVYVRSEFFKNYSGDMYVDMDKHMSTKTKPSGWLRKDGGRPIFMGTRELLSNTLSKAFEELHYSSFDKIAPTSLLIGDFDIHTGNIGVIRDPEDSTILPKLVRIDFAGSLDQLEDNIHPYSWSRHLPLLGPTNHFREFPSKLSHNDSFVKGLLDTAQVDLNKTIDDSFAELSKYYSDKALANWAKMAMCQKFKDIAPENIKIADVKDALKETMHKRQQSLKEYGLQIKLGLLVTKGKINTPKLRELVQEHPDYFNNIINQTKKLKLRKETKIKYIIGYKAREVLLIKEIVKILQEEKQLLTKKTSDLEPSMQISRKALDVMLTHETTTTNVQSSTSKVDSITLAFRQEIIAKQQALLQHVLAEANIQTDKGVAIAGLATNSQEFKEFVENNNGLIQKAWAAPSVKANIAQDMNDEVQSYAKVLQANHFKPLTWNEQETVTNTSSTRSRAIKVKDEELFKLIETNIKTSKKVMLEDGVTEREISNYRNINLPLTIKPSSTAVHLSFPVQNEKGENIASSKALYCTAHYNEQGKLVEITNPLSLKFAGDDKDAIGYIQRGNNIYTIPVTKGQYEAMVQEVAKNKECNINMSQAIIPLEASDSIGELTQIQSSLKHHVNNTPPETNTVVSTKQKTLSRHQQRNRTHGYI